MFELADDGEYGWRDSTTVIARLQTRELSAELGLPGRGVSAMFGIALNSNRRSSGDLMFPSPGGTALLPGFFMPPYRRFLAWGATPVGPDRFAPPLPDPVRSQTARSP